MPIQNGHGIKTKKLLKKKSVGAALADPKASSSLPTTNRIQIAREDNITSLRTLFKLNDVKLPRCLIEKRLRSQLDLVSGI